MVQQEDVKDKDENKKKCLYGFEKRLVYHDLIKAWQGYCNLSKDQVPDNKRILHYKRIIHKLEDKLRKPITQFSLLEVFGMYFFRLNTELFREGITNDSIEKAMIKTITILGSGMPLHERPNMAVELMRRDKALGIL